MFDLKGHILQNYCYSCNLPILVQVLAICKIRKPSVFNFIHHPENKPIQNQVKLTSNSKNMISEENYFETIVAVAVFLFQFKLLQFVKSESQVSLI